MDLWRKIRGEVKHVSNNELCWCKAISADYATLLTPAGFTDVAIGYRDATGRGEFRTVGFSLASQRLFRSWFVASGYKPAWSSLLLASGMADGNTVQNCVSSSPTDEGVNFTRVSECI